MKKIVSFLCIVLMLPVIMTGQQIENPGFEDWEAAGTVIDEPTNWSSIKTSDNTVTSNAAPVVWGQSTDAHSGSFSVLLKNMAAFGIIATGTMTNGRIDADFNPLLGYSFTDTNDARWNTPLTGRPDSIVGWIKYHPKGNDFPTVKAILHVNNAKLPENGTGDNWVALAAWDGPNATIDTWTRFSVPFVYSDERIPEYIMMTITAGNGTTAVDSSWALYDDLKLIYNGSSGIADQKKEEIFLHVSGSTIIIDLAFQELYLDKRFELIELSGKTIYSKPLTGPVISDIPAGIQQGIYVAVLHSGRDQYVQKIYLGR